LRTDILHGLKKKKDPVVIQGNQLVVRWRGCFCFGNPVEAFGKRDETLDPLNRRSLKKGDEGRKCLLLLLLLLLDG
jgi:hypothetical protein